MQYLCGKIILMSKILGLGNALTDVLATLQHDDILHALGFPKGGMIHIDEDSYQRVQDFFNKVPTTISTGGSVANSCRAMARLGMKVGFIGKVGNDHFGQLYAQSLTEVGVDNCLIVSDTLPSGVCCAFITPDGERTFADHMGASLSLRAEEIRSEVLMEYQYLFLEGYLVQDHQLIQGAAQMAKQLGLKVVMDLASYNIIKSDKDFCYLLVRDYVDIVFANEEEAKALTGKEPEDALQELSQLCDIAVVKVGSRGSYVKRGEEQVHVDAVLVDQVLDTTGAGDHFAAGFLYGLLGGLSLEQCAQVGSIVSTEVIQVIGTKLSEDKWKEIKEKVVI